MKLQFVKNILEDGSADIFLFEEIGGPRGINGAQVAEEIKFLNEVNNVSLIRLHINSPGGTVQDGLSIIGAMRASKAPVDTIAAGIAASIAGIIFLHGRKRSMNDFARLMIHSPSLPGSENGDFLKDTEKEALAQIQDLLATQLENNSNKSKKDIISLMEREIWVNADLALTWGLIDEIVDTKREGKTLVGNTIAEIYNSAAEFLNSSTTKTKTMLTVTNHLKLNDDASEQNVLEAVQNIEAEKVTADEAVTTHETTISEQSTKIEELEAEIVTLKGDAVVNEETKAVEFVENCITEGKFKAEDKENLVAQAKNNFEGFKIVANSIDAKAAHVDITDSIATPSTKAEPEVTLRDMERNDPKQLLKIRNESPELYESMYEKQYGVKLVLN